MQVSPFSCCGIAGVAAGTPGCIGFAEVGTKAVKLMLESVAGSLGGVGMFWTLLERGIRTLTRRKCWCWSVVAKGFCKQAMSFLYVWMMFMLIYVLLNLVMGKVSVIHS